MTDHTADNDTLGTCSPSDCASCSGCGSDMLVEEDHKTITLTLDDDTEVRCTILAIFPAGEREYIALLPLDENGENTSGEVYLYRFTKTPAGDPMLDNIDDDAEYEAASEAFGSIVQVMD